MHVTTVPQRHFYGCPYGRPCAWTCGCPWRSVWRLLWTFGPMCLQTPVWTSIRPKHTGIFSGYCGWKKSCTTTVHGLKLLHGTVRPIDGAPFPPTSMLRGFVVGRLLPKCLLDPPPFRMEEKLHHFGFPNWTARSTSNIDVGGKGGQHCTSNCQCWIVRFHCQHASGATFLTSTDKIPQ